MSRHAPVFDLRFARHLTRLTRIYWTSIDAKKGLGLGSLRTAIAYPAAADTFSDAAMAEALAVVDLAPNPQPPFACGSTLLRA